MSTPDPEHTAGWDRDQHGRMADHAAPDDAVTTVAGGGEEGDDPDAA